MEFQVLGPVGLRDGVSPVPLTGSLRSTLLGVLLARANAEVSMDVLADTLWDGRPGARATQRQHQHAHRLRRVLDDPDRLTFVRGSYRLRVLPGELDAERFETLLDAHTDVTARRRVEVLRTALGLHGCRTGSPDRSSG
ncbi:MAG: hypothetical protein GEV28_20695 [Actinophytocola sp.]|uniref:AfsR/SARP family transcriptional regulator n=1 Tax=Actinophytocola sp. TaxID=1872138 RepID=UPI00132A2D23|nr:hypothetical protein [Actinophytocola sp.]MPZ82684.1 hypothetical protein [Actinophytocola sp.]